MSEEKSGEKNIRDSSPPLGGGGRGGADGASPAALAWRRLKKSKPAVFGMVLIAIAIFISVFAYQLSPDNTPDANEMLPEIALMPPGFAIDFLKVKKDKEENQSSFITNFFSGKENSFKLIPVLKHEVKGKFLIAYSFTGEGLEPDTLTFNLADVAFANSLSDTSTKTENGKIIFTDFSGHQQKIPLTELRQQVERENFTRKTFWLGTDTYGRDILSRLLIGTRISLSVGGIAVFISLIIGILLGALAGYFRGTTDAIISWLINVIWAIPTLLFVFAITVALGKGFWQIFFAVGLTMWVGTARVIRGQVMSLRELGYIEAARSMGYSHLRIILRHIIPNVIGPVMVMAASNFATAILVEAGLSFLGIGVQAPTPSWGSMIRDNYGFIVSGNPWMAIIPGVAIMILVLAFNLLGNGLRDALDVRTQMK